jgi:hypothetical protein
MLVPRNLAAGDIVIDAEDFLLTTTSKRRTKPTPPATTSPSNKRRKRRQRSAKTGTNRDKLGQANVSLLVHHTTSPVHHPGRNVSNAAQRPLTSVSELHSTNWLESKSLQRQHDANNVRSNRPMTMAGSSTAMPRRNRSQGTHAAQGRNPAIDARIQTLARQSQHIGENLSREVELLSLSMKQEGGGVTAGILGQLRADANSRKRKRAGKSPKHRGLRGDTKLTLQCFAQWKRKVATLRKYRRGIEASTLTMNYFGSSNHD